MLKSLGSISSWPTQKSPWLLLAGSGLIFELIALYFQYGMGLEPCIMCIYQRVAVLGLVIAGLIGATAPNSTLVRAIAFVTWGVSSVWGTLIALEHVEMQTNTNPFAFFSCDIIPNFPSWMPLHEWIPGMFEPRGTCGDIDWQFLGYSMPQWMIVVFSIYAVVFLLCFAIRFKHTKLI